jgi:hypothetical protein
VAIIPTDVSAPCPLPGPLLGPLPRSAAADTINAVVGTACCGTAVVRTAVVRTAVL